jgi:hypothetical protein
MNILVCDNNREKLVFFIAITVSFSTDNASVMTGRHKGVLGLLHQENPQIYGIGCACHLSALAAKHGSKALKLFNLCYLSF